MSIDLGNTPTPPNANPTTQESDQIKSVLGLNPRPIKHFDASDPTVNYIDYNTTLTVSGATLNGITIPPKTFQYAGMYNGYYSYTEDGFSVDEFSDSVYYNIATNEVKVILNGITFTGSSMQYPQSLNEINWSTGYPDATDPTDFVFPLNPTVASQGTGQVLVWKSSGYSGMGGSYGDPYDSYFISAFKDQGPTWIRFLNYGGDYGEPLSIGLSGGYGLSLATGVTGTLATSNGGTGATTSTGIAGSNTTRLTIEDNSSTAITLSDSFSGKILRTTSNSAVTITIPSNLGAKFNLRVIQQGTGVVTFAGTGITIQSKLTYKKISNQFGAVDLLRVASATYNLSGDLMA